MNRRSNQKEREIAPEIVKGFQSTSGDDFQLNTITFLKNAAQYYPEVEIVSRNFDGSPFRYTYHAAHQRVKKLANALKRLGIGPGDRVGVMEWNTHRFYELYVAVSGIGAVLVQFNPRIASVDRAYVINHSGVRFIFITELMIPLLEPVANTLGRVEGYGVITDSQPGQITTNLHPVHDYEQLLAKEMAEFDWPMIDETSAFSACYTSGTTGNPKGGYYSHRCIYLHAMTAAANFSVTMNDVMMQTVPMLEYIRSLPEKTDFTGLRMASGATEPSLALMKGFQELGGVEIIHAYGATETAPIVTANFLKPSLAGISQEEKWELKKKQGIPVAGLDFKVVDMKGKEVPHDGVTVGELLIRGPWITAAYHNDPRNAESFVDGYWKSGDAGTADRNGYLKISDRFKDLIKSGGEWISSIDLENAIMAHPEMTAKSFTPTAFSGAAIFSGSVRGTASPFTNVARTSSSGWLQHQRPGGGKLPFLPQQGPRGGGGGHAR
jgi:fatty-acyl-CoA synthase